MLISLAACVNSGISGGAASNNTVGSNSANSSTDSNATSGDKKTVTHSDGTVIKYLQDEFGFNIVTIPMDGNADALTMFMAGETDVDRMVESLEICFNDPDFQANMETTGSEMYLLLDDDYRSLLVGLLDRRLEIWGVEK